MNEAELVGFKAVINTLVDNKKRALAYELLDYFFERATTLQEFDAIGELSLKKDYRDLHLRCAEISNGLAITTRQKRAARTNLIAAYNTMNYPEKASTLVDLQLQISPDDYDTLTHKISVLFLQNRKEEAEEIIESLLEKYTQDKFPEQYKELRNSLAGKLLKEGNLAEGILVFITALKKENDLFDNKLRMKQWDGTPIAGRKLYINSEGGVGDEIINVRFLKNIENLGMKPVLVSPNNEWHRDKNKLFKRHGIDIVSEDFLIDKEESWVPMMSLPGVLNLTEKDLWNGPYLTPLKKKQIKSNKFKIGIKCSGNPYFAQDEYRKIPLDLMVSYLPQDAELYYIDKLKVDHPRVINMADQIDNWEDTLDIVDSMDCIVSSCTSLVHAAGAIGKTTIVCVPIAEYYVWTSSRTDDSTPWYGDNLHIMRQSTPRDWNDPLRKMNTLVKQLMG